MADQETKAPGGASGNRTIQIDALTDVQLIDHLADAPAGRAPPPLPRKPRASPLGKIVALVLAMGLGVLCALGLMHFFFPSAEIAAPTAALPPRAAPPPLEHAPEPTPAAAPAPSPAADVRHVHMDEELVIRGPAPETP